MMVTSLLFVKARFYTHLLEPSKKMFAWEDRYIIHCSGALAILLRTCGVLIEVTVDLLIDCHQYHKVCFRRLQLING